MCVDAHIAGSLVYLSAAWILKSSLWSVQVEKTGVGEVCVSFFCRAVLGG